MEAGEGQRGTTILKCSLFVCRLFCWLWKLMENSVYLNFPTNFINIPETECVCAEQGVLNSAPSIKYSRFFTRWGEFLMLFQGGVSRILRCCSTTDDEYELIQRAKFDRGMRGSVNFRKIKPWDCQFACKINSLWLGWRLHAPLCYNITAKLSGKHDKLDLVRNCHWKTSFNSDQRCLSCNLIKQVHSRCYSWTFYCQNNIINRFIFVQV